MSTTASIRRRKRKQVHISLLQEGIDLIRAGEIESFYCDGANDRLERSNVIWTIKKHWDSSLMFTRMYDGNWPGGSVFVGMDNDRALMDFVLPECERTLADYRHVAYATF